MKSEWTLLVEALEAEKKLLQAHIDDCVKFWDYLGAHHHAQALALLNRKLRIVHTLKDPHHNQKTWAKETLERLQQQLDQQTQEADLPGRYQRFYDRQLQELEALHRIPLRPWQDSQQLDTLIDEVVTGKLPAFKLHFQPKDALYLRFSRPSTQQLLINFPSPVAKTDALLIPGEGRALLAAVGFIENTHKDQLEMPLNLSTYRHALPIKESLALIIYDAFRQERPDKNAYVELAHG